MKGSKLLRSYTDRSELMLHNSPHRGVRVLDAEHYLLNYKSPGVKLRNLMHIEDERLLDTTTNCFWKQFQFPGKGIREPFVCSKIFHGGEGAH